MEYKHYLKKNNGNFFIPIDINSLKNLRLIGIDFIWEEKEK